MDNYIFKGDPDQILLFWGPAVTPAGLRRLTPITRYNFIAVCCRETHLLIKFNPHKSKSIVLMIAEQHCVKKWLG